jgi:hypothetical protein
MTEPSTSAVEPKGTEMPAAKPDKLVKPEPRIPERVLLVPYPKFVFLYPTLLVSLLSGISMSAGGWALQQDSTGAVVTALIFLAIAGANITLLAFDFPRATSLTLFFFLLAVGLAAALVFTLHPEWLPAVFDIVKHLRPLANAAFYWTFSAILATIYVVVMVVVRFDYWEVRPNELLHHHGILSNLERHSAPNLRIDKEINDVFEYLLMRSGRLILMPSSERRAIVLDNVPFIDKKEEAITRMLGALQVQVRNEG